MREANKHTVPPHKHRCLCLPQHALNVGLKNNSPLSICLRTFFLNCHLCFPLRRDSVHVSFYVSTISRLFLALFRNSDKQAPILTKRWCLRMAKQTRSAHISLKGICPALHTHIIYDNNAVHPWIFLQNPQSLPSAPTTVERKLITSNVFLRAARFC